MEKDAKVGLLLFCLFIVTISLRAQMEQFHIQKKDVSLREVLKEIEKKTGVTFVYSDDNINADRRVSLSGDFTLANALGELFGNTDIKIKYSKGKVILYKPRSVKKGKHVLSGLIRTKESSELLPMANIYLPELELIAASNSYGFYSILLPEDSLTVIFSYAGCSPKKIRIRMNKDQELNVDLASYQVLKEVVVTSLEKESEAVNMGHISMPVSQMKDMPYLLGEKDIFKMIQLLPGVKRGTEGSSGFYVRGGGSDQNLILLDDAPVYNANHLFGFFSALNGNAVKSVDFYKGGFPSRYGGRLSSVLDIRLKDGNQNEVHGEGSVGLISSNFTLEGPIKKNKISAMIAARRTYYDVVSKPFPQAGAVQYYFYDANARLSFNINNANKVYLSGYFGSDNLNAPPEKELLTTNSYSLLWGNQTATLRWNHEFSNKVFGNASLIFSNFKLNAEANQLYWDTTYHSRYSTAIRDWNLKYDVDIFSSLQHHIQLGGNFIFHRFNPGALVVTDPSILDFKNLNNPVYDFETALYAEDQWKVTPKLALNFGARLTGFSDTFSSIKFNPEPRLNVSYQFRDNWAVKGGYSQMYQYIHLLSNTGLGLPTDLWVPSSAKIPHQGATQEVLGIVHDLPKAGISISVEAYNKKMTNVVNYKPGSTFLAIDKATSEQYLPWEDKVTSGQGWSQGIELFVQKKSGRLNGWVGYTLSKTELQFDEINFGEKFYATYDRRHDLSIVGFYKLSSHITLSGTWIYQSGNRITVPQNKYQAYYFDLYHQRDGEWREVTDYGSKNSFKTPDYHRLDLTVQFHKQKKKYERVWQVGVYNAYYRKNPFFYDIVTNQHESYLQGYNVFPIVPSFSYQIKF